MQVKVLTRIAAIFIVIHLIGHTMGHITWRDTADPVKKEVIRQMTEPKFDFMGTSRSMANYYEGYSLYIVVVYLMLISLLWITSGFIESHKDIARKILYPIAISLLFFCAVEFIFFFPFAAVISLCAGIVVIVAILKLNKTIV